VLKAEHRRMERLVALKVLSPKFTESPAAVARFQREVKAAAKLNHQNIVTAYDADEAGGTHFLVMEYVEGTDLSALVKKDGPLPFDRALHCVIQAARGLEYAHGRGVVHRDIKPANLLLDRDGTVKILDMGLARLDSAGEHQDELTGTGQIMGTIDYMAPEQALSTKSADRRADIYSLGITLWYLLTGRPAYSGDTAMAKLLAHRERAIPSIRDACPAAPPSLDAVFARMVAKTPEARYQTMTEVIADLERCRAGKEVTAPSVASAPGEDSRLSEFLRGLEQSSAGRGVTGKPLGKVAIAPAITAPHVIEETLANTLPAGDTDPTTQQSLGVNAELLRDGGAAGWLRKLPFAPTRRNLALAGGGAALLVAMIAGLWYTNRGTVRVADNDLLAPASGRVPGDAPATSHASGGRQPPGDGAAAVYQWPAGTPAPAIAPFDAAQATKHQEEWAAHLGVPVEYTNSIGMKFRLIPPGEFMMGSTPDEIASALVVAGDDENWKRYIHSESPRHKVILTRPVYFGVHEVTQAQYDLVCGQNPSHFGASGPGKDVIAGMDTTSHPVETVSWNDAVEFCGKLSEKEQFQPYKRELRAGEAVTTEGTGYRLPTEAEWEFACRAGTTTKYWTGNQDESLVEAGWFNSNSVGRTHRVEELKANPFGLFDIHGNVWEWVQDWWEPNYYAQHQGKPALDPSGPFSAGSQRVIRGGLWLYHLSYCRASARNATGPARRDRTFGFRVALSVDAVRAGQSGQPPPAIAPFDAAQAKKHQEDWAAHLGVPVEYTNSIGMKFRLIPPGEFDMGGASDEVKDAIAAAGADEPWKEHLRSEMPWHKVILTQPVYLGVHEVTQRDYQAVTGTNPAHFGPQGAGKDAVAGKDTSRHPVDTVNWIDAAEFCVKLSERESCNPCYSRSGNNVTVLGGAGYRLPTEAEWEYACRAGTTTRFWVGDDDQALMQAGWFAKNSEGFPHMVGSLPSNPFGLCDLHGNVWEWVQDWWSPGYYGLFVERPAIDPQGASSASKERVIRGGNWLNPASDCRSSVRNSGDPSSTLYSVGFRVALSVDAVRQNLRQSGAIDVLSLADVDRDSIRHEGRIGGRWQWQDGNRKVLKSTGNMSLIEFPLDLAGDYRLRLRVQKLGVVPNEGLILGLRIAGQPATLVLGYFRNGKVTHGIEEQNSTEGEPLPSGREFEVTVTVDGRSVLATADGNTLFQFDGDPQRLVGPGEEFWKRRDPAHLSLGCGGDHWRVIACDYEPLKKRTSADVQADRPTNVASIAGAALQFDGQAGHVHVPTLSRDDAGPMTVEAWVRPEVQEGHKAVALLSGRHPLQINTFNDRLYAFDSRTSFRDIDEDTLPKFVPGQWHHMAAVCDEANIRFFVDGRRQGQFPLQAADVQVPRAFSGLWLGGHPHAQRPKRIEYRYRGQIDEVRVSRGARYRDDFQPPRRMDADADTLALYHCDEAAGDVLADASGHGHEGRIVGAQWTVVWDSNAPAPAIAPFDAEQAKKYQEAWAAHLGVPVEYTNSIGMKFRLIPPGEFTMGSTPEEIEAALVAAGADESWKTYIRTEAPQHKVILSQPVYLGMHEVTQAEYERILGANPSHFAATGPGMAAVVGHDTSTYPVEQASWNDAAEFCARLSETEKLKPSYYSRSGESVTMLAGNGYRLPTEAEWEFACRAGTTTEFWIGANQSKWTEAGWFVLNSGGRTHGIGSGKSNPFGLCDTHGNVWEWVQDEWDTMYYGQFAEMPAIDPVGPTSTSSQRAVRGGGWADTASGCRASGRYAHGPSFRNFTIGFRVALSVEAVRQSIDRNQAAVDSELTAYDILTSPDWEWTEPERLGPLVNTELDDSQPWLSADGLTLYFQSQQPGAPTRQDLWFSHRRALADPWEAKVIVGPPVSTPENDDLAPSLSADGLQLLFARTSGPGQWEIWQATRASIEAPWSPPVKLGPEINEHPSAAPCPSADGLTLLFASARPGSLGDTDIWMSTRTSREAAWTPPMNLGPQVNSAQQEIPDWLSPDGRCLVLSVGRSVAAGRPGARTVMDLWLCTRASAQAEWSLPVKLDPPLNHDTGSWHATLSADGRNIVFYRRDDGGAGKADLWQSRRVRKGHSAEHRSDRANSKDRAVAEWVHALGGTVGIANDLEKFQVVKPDQPLPDGRLTLTIVDLLDCRLTNDDPLHLDRLPHLATLILRNTGITDAGLEALGDLPALQQIYLGSLKVTPGGLRTLLRYQGLTTLGMSSVDRAQLEVIALISNLSELRVSGSPIGDADLPVLATLEHLTSLNVEQTQVTQAGVDALCKLLPNCRVKTSFGEFGPLAGNPP
jgi:formylglycine-generating enzyme required for sulfatase activity